MIRTRPGAGGSKLTDEAALEKLRRVMVGPEQARLARVESGATLSPEHVGRVLPEAVAQSSAARGDALSIALEPAVTSAFRTVARKDSEFLGEILAPTIGAAVRKAVTEAISVMLQRFNETLERSLSWRSVQWRLEARRTGRPFAEVVMLRTLVYRVEQVFLIHSDSGLVLDHVVANDVESQSPDQVASMISAIDAFVHDAFGLEPNAHLREMRVGDLVVWVERDRSLTLAAVIRGMAPRTYAEALREAHERILLRHQADLVQFRSDISPFAASRSVVEACLTAQRRRPPRRAHIILIAAAALVLGLTALLMVRGHLRHAAQARTLATYVRVLQAEPGIVVTSASSAGRHVRLAGFEDPLSANPADVLARARLPAAELKFQPFLSMDPRLAAPRARQMLRAPPGVRLDVSEGTLRASGVAPRTWIQQAGWMATAVPGVQSLDDRDLHPMEEMGRLGQAKEALRRLSVGFSVGSARIGPPERGTMSRVERAARQAVDAARAAGFNACVAITGHADTSGTDAANQKLSLQRAIAVAAELQAHGVEQGQLRAIGGGVLVARGPDARTVNFQLLTAERSAGAACEGAP